jgi:hypothetical protein
MDKEDQRFVINYFWIKGWGAKRIRQALTSTLGDDASGWSQIKIWLQRFNSSDFPCTDLPSPDRPPLTVGTQLEAFLHKYPFTSAGAITEHFMTTVLVVKEILQRKLGMRKFSRRWVLHSLSSPQQVARVEASKDMLRILQELQANHFYGIATGDKSWFQYGYSPSEMFAHSRSDVIPKTRQAIGTTKTMITVFFTPSKLIVLEVLPKGRNFNRRDFLDNTFPDLKRESMRHRRWKRDSTFGSTWTIQSATIVQKSS